MEISPLVAILLILTSLIVSVVCEPEPQLKSDNRGIHSLRAVSNRVSHAARLSKNRRQLIIKCCGLKSCLNPGKRRRMSTKNTSPKKATTEVPPRYTATAEPTTFKDYETPDEDISSSEPTESATEVMEEESGAVEDDTSPETSEISSEKTTQEIQIKTTNPPKSTVTTSGVILTQTSAPVTRESSNSPPPTFTEAVSTTHLPAKISSSTTVATSSVHTSPTAHATQSAAVTVNNPTSTVKPTMASTVTIEKTTVSPVNHPSSSTVTPVKMQTTTIAPTIKPTSSETPVKSTVNNPTSTVMPVKEQTTSQVPLTTTLVPVTVSVTSAPANNPTTVIAVKEQTISQTPAPTTTTLPPLTEQITTTVTPMPVNEQSTTMAPSSSTVAPVIEQTTTQGIVNSTVMPVTSTDNPVTSTDTPVATTVPEQTTVIDQTMAPVTVTTAVNNPTTVIVTSTEVAQPAATTLPPSTEAPTTSTTSTLPPTTTTRPMNCTCPPSCLCDDSKDQAVLDADGTLESNALRGNWTVLCGIPANATFKNPGDPMAKTCCYQCMQAETTSTKKMVKCSIGFENSQLIADTDGNTELKFDMANRTGDCATFVDGSYKATITRVSNCSSRLVVQNDNGMEDSACDVLKSWVGCAQPLNIKSGQPTNNYCNMVKTNNSDPVKYCLAPQAYVCTLTTTTPPCSICSTAECNGDTGRRDNAMSSVTVTQAPNASLTLIPLRTKYYYFETTNKMSWFDALTFCRTHGMDLNTIIKKDERDAIYEYIEKILKLNAAQFWFSLNKMSSCVYAWVSDPMVLKHWAAGEPQRLAATTNCAVILNKHWSSYNCSAPANFICETF